jgi:hypothetical protein
MERRNGRKIKMTLPANVPDTEFSEEFVDFQKNRMALSYYKYGPVSNAFPSRVDAIETAERYLELYKQSGNKERLVDAANYLMIEFMHPKHPDAHFKATDSKGSPGRKWHGEVDFSQRKNSI